MKTRELAMNGAARGNENIFSGMPVNEVSLSSC